MAAHLDVRPCCGGAVGSQRAAGAFGRFEVDDSPAGFVVAAGGAASVDLAGGAGDLVGVEVDVEVRLR